MKLHLIIENDCMDSHEKTVSLKFGVALKDVTIGPLDAIDEKQCDCLHALLQHSLFLCNQ